MQGQRELEVKVMAQQDFGDRQHCLGVLPINFASSSTLDTFDKGGKLFVPVGQLEKVGRFLKVETPRMVFLFLMMGPFLSFLVLPRWGSVIPRALAHCVTDK
jgi:hypothetical protein